MQRYGRPLLHTSIPKARFFAAGFGHCPRNIPNSFPHIIYIHVIALLRLSTAVPFEEHNSRHRMFAYDSFPPSQPYFFFPVAIGNLNPLGG